MISLAPILLVAAPTPTGLLAPLAHEEATSQTPPAAAAPTKRPAGQEVLAIHMVDMEDMLKDPKDAGLLAAFDMLPARLMELGNEIPGWELPAPMVPMLTEVLSGAKTLTVHLDETLGPIPVRAQLNMHMGGAEAANEFHGKLLGMMAGSGAPLGDVEDGMTPLYMDPDMPPVLFGPRGNDFVVAFGGIDDAPFDAGNTGLPDGVQADMVMRLDYGTMLGFMFDWMAPMGVQEDPEFAMMMDLMDFVGLENIQFHMASGSDQTRSYSTFQMPGYGRHMRNHGLVGDKTVSANMLRMVPVDAQMASVFIFDVASCAEWINEMASMALAEEGIDDPLTMAGQMVGIDFRKDVLDHIGSEMGFYMSDTTGGGSLASAVFFMELTNPEGLAPMLGRMNSMITDLGQAEADGYVASRKWNHGDMELVSLSFPGLPIPVEPTYTIAGNHMIFALSPQAAIAASRQAHGASTSLLDNVHFAAQMPGSLEGVQGIDFMNTPALLADGYVWSNMLFTAIQNGVRSPQDGERDPGPVLPPYHELASGALATVNVTMMDGDDLVVRGVGDRSMCVQITAMTGFLSSSGLGALLPLMMFGAVRDSQSSAALMVAEDAYWEEVEAEWEEPEEIEDHEESDGH